MIEIGLVIVIIGVLMILAGVNDIRAKLDLLLDLHLEQEDEQKE